MNAIQFIKEHGVDKAREVVEGAPDKSVYCRDMDSVCSPNEVLYYAWFGGALLVKDEDKGWTKSIYHTGEEYILDQLEKIDDLKRLVESVDIITKVGGIREAIEEHTKWMHAPELHLYRIGESVERLKQAIADYEQLFGNTETLELETLRDCDTSPNCKKFDERVK